jgi:hypothetical protein
VHLSSSHLVLSASERNGADRFQIFCYGDGLIGTVVVTISQRLHSPPSSRTTTPDKVAGS